MLQKMEAVDIFYEKLIFYAKSILKKLTYSFKYQIQQ